MKGRPGTTMAWGEKTRRWIGYRALALLCTVAIAPYCRGEEQRQCDPTPAMGPHGECSSSVPADCPFPASPTLRGLRFTGRHARYTNADTWYPSWASDGNLYSPWTDGAVNGTSSSSLGPNATTGHATIVGNDPMSLQVINQRIRPGDPTPYAGRYPCGSLVYNGVWYYGTYCLAPDGWVEHEGYTYNWPWLGPVVGFRYSTDLGATWTDTTHTPANPLFGESGLNGQPLKIGAPHFVDFGKNMVHSPDGKAYLVGHGAVDPDTDPCYANLSWITGDQIYLTRVTPSIENINDPTKYEFFAGFDEQDQAVWSSDPAQTAPIAEWNNNMGCVTVTYNEPLKKYLMCVTDGGATTSTYNTYILESDQVCGPWKMVTYLEQFGQQAYFVNIPSKFISEDGCTMWLCYSANFAEGVNGAHFESLPTGSGYGMCLQEITLNVVSTPEPGACTLMTTGLAGWLVCILQRQRALTMVKSESFLRGE